MLAASCHCPGSAFETVLKGCSSMQEARSRCGDELGETRSCQPWRALSQISSSSQPALTHTGKTTSIIDTLGFMSATMSGSQDRSSR